MAQPPRQSIVSSLIALSAALLLLLAQAPVARGEDNPPPEVIGRYHVTVTMQTRADVDAARVTQSLTRDLHDASGTIINKQGIVVTAAHVALSTRNTAVITAHDGSTYSARVLHVAPDAEVAVLKTNRPWRFDISPPPVNRTPQAGDAVTGIGLSAAARPGAVRTPRRNYEYRFGRFGFRDPIVLEMAVESGFSGGPVFDANNHWLGMIVGYGLSRNSDGKVVNTGQTYVLPAKRVLEMIRGYR